MLQVFVNSFIALFPTPPLSPEGAVHSST